MNFFRRESTWDKVTKPLTRAGGGQTAKAGLTAGATVLAVSVASAVTSALRKREQGA